MTNRSSQTHFFATKEDIYPAIERIELQRNLQYALCDLYTANEPKLYRSLLLIEDLGFCATGNAARSSAYLVVPENKPIHLRAVHQRKGDVLYSLSQAENPQSIVFCPGGLYQNDCLVVGSVGTASNDALSITLYHDFAKELTHGFTKVRRYLVGPAALQLLDRDKRLLTIGVREPRTYDLRR